MGKVLAVWWVIVFYGLVLIPQLGYTGGMTNSQLFALILSILVPAAGLLIMGLKALRKLNRVDVQFVAVDGRFDVLSEKLKSIDTRFVAVDTRFNSIDSGINRIETQLATLNGLFIAHLEKHK
jgi:uncharacterized protein YdcH (DUF465 family)